MASSHSDSASTPRRRSRRRRLAGITIVVLLFAAGGGYLAASSSRPATPFRNGHAVKRAHVEPATPAVGATGAAAGPTAQWVKDENAKPGTSQWRLASPQHQGDIEGFADRVSAQPGDAVQLFVSTAASTLHVEAYRMGYYQGLGARLVWQSPTTPGVRQPAPSVESPTNTVEANWRPTMTVQTDPSWPPGQYLFKLVSAKGAQQYIPLTLRDDASRAAFLVQSSVTTWQAYNDWGGYDLYEGKHGHGAGFAYRARTVSFDRPYGFGDGAADFLALEYPLVSLMESNGLDVSYTTDIDVHERPPLLLNHRALLSLGHDEYWSTSMRDGFEAARDHGVNIAFLGANAAYRHVRFAPSTLGADREIVDYKQAKEDPLLHADPSEVTVNWRDPPVNRPENTLIGDFYQCNPVKADMVVIDTDNWLFVNTGVKNGTRLHGAVGSEYDRYVPGPGVPPDVEVVAHSPLRCQGHADYADATYYTTPRGAAVFATGTINWIPTLAATCDTCSGVVLARITENLLAAFGTGPAGLAHPSQPNTTTIRARPAPVGAHVPSSTRSTTPATHRARRATR